MSKTKTSIPKGTVPEATTSNKKSISNRANALKSTGPRTPAGKLIVGQNARKHGLLSEKLTFANARQKSEYNQFRADLEKDVAPEGMREQMMVEEIASSWLKQQTAQLWSTRDLKSRRKLATASMSFVSDKDRWDQYSEFKPEHPFDARLTTSIESLLRYEITSKRAMYKAMDQLDMLQQSRAVKRNGPPKGEQGSP
jgi:hypothetical protein